MSNDSSETIVSKVWNYAHDIKKAEVGYGDYVEVRAAPAFIAYLLLAPTFSLRADAQPCGLPVSPSARLLKLANEVTELGFDNPIPAEFQWAELASRSGDELEWSGATWTTRQGCPKGGRGDAHQLHYRHTLENLGNEPGLFRFETCK